MASRCPYCKCALKAHQLEFVCKVPEGCVCDPKDWGDPESIPAICAEFVPEPGWGDSCKTCDHDFACHS